MAEFDIDDTKDSPETRAIVRELRSMLLQSEHDIDDSLTSTAQLLARLPSLRVRANLAAPTGQKVFQAAARAATQLAEARGAVAEAHTTLEALARVLKIPIVMDDGGTVKTPDEQFTWSPMGASSGVRSAVPVEA